MTCQEGQKLPFDIVSYRIIFYKQSIAGANELTKNLKKSIMELLNSLNRTNNPVQDAISRRSSLGLRLKTPLVKLVNLKDLNSYILKMFKAEGILYGEDIKKLNLERMKLKYSLGKNSLEKIVKLILDNDLYTNVEELQDFILRYRLGTNKTYKEISRGY